MYPEVHKNPRDFFNSSSPILLEPLANGSGDWSFPSEDCISSFLRGSDTEMQQLMKCLEHDQHIHWHGLKDGDVVHDIF